MAGNRITWDIGKYDPDTHYVYRSDSPMNPNNLPTPLTTLGAGISVYEDTDNIVEGNTYYYRVDAEKMGLYIPGYEIEHFVSSSTINIHDLFEDGSALATYTLQGTPNDIGGNYNGSWQGTESYVNDLGTQVADFSGNSAINLGSPLLGQDFTISVWVKFNTKNIRQAMVTQYSSGDYMFWIESNNQVKPGYAGNDATGTNYIISTNQWYHMVTTRNSNNDHSLYVDGVLQGTGSTNSSPSSSDNTVIADTTNYPEFSLEGQLSQVRIFNREVTQEEVDTLYAEHSGDV